MLVRSPDSCLTALGIWTTLGDFVVGIYCIDGKYTDGYKVRIHVTTFFFTCLFSLILAIIAFWVLNDTPAKITKWLTPKEKKLLILCNQYAAGGETGIGEKEEFS